jgi:hypothetical protein
VGSYDCDQEDHVTIDVWQREADRANRAEAEIERLRREVILHGWTVDCSRCAALIDGSVSDIKETS